MGDMLSQAEIDALLRGTSLDDYEDEVQTQESDLTPQEIDAIGEIGNICIGTSATTLFTLLGQKVTITTPKVSVTTWEQLAKDYPIPYVGVRIKYTEGLIGTNMLILKENDVKVITDLMMGGDGTNVDGDLTELHFSAISEAMNQMIGSSATSMSSLFDKRIDISPPVAFLMTFADSGSYGDDFEKREKVVKVAFKMVIGDIIDSEIMQLIPLSFAKVLVENLLNIDIGEGNVDISTAINNNNNKSAPKPNFGAEKPMQPQQPNMYQQPQTAMHESNYDMGYTNQMYSQNTSSRPRNPVNVQPVQFQNFDDSTITVEKKNISLIMDVPLQVTVELGRTHKLIKDILEFGPGSIIELDKLAGEPVDILVNGKYIAKGEVVVIDESFGVRVTDIIHPSKRL
ncbi:MAG TPA: flagellar motor switch phosphatase FliY [Clostridiaceae bacterium]|nr:flagellar motor switch phosphatase FliY [Clostridiaceae bacterium]HHV99050.1 flagellar motor switch phosphatase FliY [Clostridiaceae bacterium]